MPIFKIEHHLEPDGPIATYYDHFTTHPTARQVLVHFGIDVGAHEEVTVTELKLFGGRKVISLCDFDWTSIQSTKLDLLTIMAKHVDDAELCKLEGVMEIIQRLQTKAAWATGGDEVFGAPD